MKKPIFNIYKKPIEKEIEVLSWFVLAKTNFEWLLEYWNINSREFYSKESVERREILKNKVEEIYDRESENFEIKIKNIKDIVHYNYEYICKILAKIFNVQYCGEQVYNVEVGISPICPRHLDEKSFDLNVISTIKYNFQIILHEIIHFYWFEKFKQVFPSVQRREYERPNVVWVLSEIVVDPIIKNSGLKRFLVNNPAYDVFYETEINGQNLIEKFNKIYQNSNNIEGFIKESMEFVMSNKIFFENLANNC